MDVGTRNGRTKGTSSFGKRNLTALCLTAIPRPTRSALVAVAAPSITKRRPALSAVTQPPRSAAVNNWSVKGKRRKTTGTGRMSYLKHVARRFKNHFREGTYQVDSFFAQIFCCGGYVFCDSSWLLGSRIGPRGQNYQIASVACVHYLIGIFVPLHV
ncbi:hypothetical protein BC937DRAFT_94692 [Endogone sp. FLAS-F59071]|nr:hypothetical protein BC937DRAFT_94692 [Endogone sp. FLAS-F59071]|eukprot:RUS20653.1 hypothetical protein BC937DRAFT_94692 [Endogone sp. FLAS-F59071]